MGFEERKSLRVVEAFLIARRALYDTVYHHRTVRSAEGMVALFLRRVKDVFDPDTFKAASGFVKPLFRMIAGDVLSPAELISLDDFSLWVLIDTIVSFPDVDETAKDLGQRILARDLFKLVPCPPERVADFLANKEAYRSIYDAIQPYCPGKPEYYVLADRVGFKMFSTRDDERGYFVTDGKAIPMRHHPLLKQYDEDKAPVTRLFTIREAVQPLANLINQRR